MSNDRELLELAAKAAGLNINGWYGEAEADGPWAMCNPRPSEDVGWNPLTNDGDALRLAVRMKMVVNICGHFTFVCGLDTDVEELHNGDPYAATRRAIVRAAAEIGRNM